MTRTTACPTGLDSQPVLTFSLHLAACISGTITDNYFNNNDDVPALKAAVACLILGFIGGLALFFMYIAAALGARGLPVKVSGFAVASWTVVWTFLGVVIGGAKVGASWTGAGRRGVVRRRVREDNECHTDH